MPSLNKIELIGRLTRDPELTVTQTGLNIAKFSVAVDRRAKDQSGEKVTDFFRCTAFRQTAEFADKFCEKGRLVYVEGRAEINQGTDKDNIKRDYFDIVVQNIELLDSKKDRDVETESVPTPAPKATPNKKAPAKVQPVEEEDNDDSDPFADE